MARVCEEFGVNKKKTVLDIRRSKEKIREYAVKFNVSDSEKPRRRMRASKEKDLGEVVYKRYIQEHSCGVNVRGVQIMDACSKLADHKGINFKAIVMDGCGDSGTDMNSMIRRYAEKLGVQASLMLNLSG